MHVCICRRMKAGETRRAGSRRWSNNYTLYITNYVMLCNMSWIYIIILLNIILCMCVYAGGWRRAKLVERAPGAGQTSVIYKYYCIYNNHILMLYHAYLWDVKERAHTRICMLHAHRPSPQLYNVSSINIIIYQIVYYTSYIVCIVMGRDRLPRARRHIMLWLVHRALASCVMKDTELEKL